MEEVNKSIQLLQIFSNNILKKFEFGNVIAKFPSVGFGFGSYHDIKALIEAEKKSPLNNFSIVCLPLSKSDRVINYLLNNKTKEEIEMFYHNHPIMMDWETEYWYKCDSKTPKVKEAFKKLKGKPEGWETLFPESKTMENRRNGLTAKKDYLDRLKAFFSDDKKITPFVTSILRYAYDDMNARIIAPPTPLIIDRAISLEVSLKINETFNKIRSIKGIFKTVSYNIHEKVFDLPSIFNKITQQIYNLTPEIVIISGVDCDRYLFPKNIYNGRKANFDKFIDDLSAYSKSHGAIVIWQDKGDFSSSYGLKLIKEGLDCFIYPLKGRSSSSGFKGGDGPAYANILDETSYYKWTKYVEMCQIRGEVPCEKECCKGLTVEDIENMLPNPQWIHKKVHEIITRNHQFNHILTKLQNEGNLNDYEVVLTKNLIL
jgi:hypothetical protein